MKMISALFVSLIVARAATINVVVAPAPAVAAAPAAASSQQALELTLEIENYNYLDLSKKTCPQVEKSLNKKPKKRTSDEAVKEIDGDVDKVAEEDEYIDAEVESATGFDHGHGLPWARTQGASKVESLLESNACSVKHKTLAAIHSHSNECMTVMEVFRSTVSEVVQSVIKCNFHKAAMAVKVGGFGGAEKAFLQSARQAPPSAIPSALLPNPEAPPVAVFTTFYPGDEIGSGRSVNVVVSITPKANDQGVAAPLSAFQPVLQYVTAKGLLASELKKALQILTDIVPQLGKAKIQMKTIEAWDVKKCEGHVKNIVDQLSHYYTREHVPLAMYNECTNFMTRMSFSHDHVLDPQDTALCRKTTAQFAKHWDQKEKANGEDFELMCARACEAKFGKDAPRCNIPAAGPAGAPAASPATAPAGK